MEIMLAVVQVIVGVLICCIPLHLLGALMLGLQYSFVAEYNQYQVPKLFALKWILITGLPGFMTSGDQYDGLFWRHIRNRMDDDRSNAVAITACKDNLRRLKKLPRTEEVSRAIGVEGRKLTELRAHDNEVVGTIGVAALTADVVATGDSVEALDTTKSDVRLLSRS